MPAGRPKRHDRPRTVHVSLPSSLVNKVDLLLLDARGRPQFAARSKLIERLLRTWVQEQGEEEKENGMG